jgi:hypothetical protein
MFIKCAGATIVGGDTKHTGGKMRGGRKVVKIQERKQEHAITVRSSQNEKKEDTQRWGSHSHHIIHCPHTLSLPNSRCQSNSEWREFTRQTCTWSRPWCPQTRRAWPTHQATTGGQRFGFRVTSTLPSCCNEQDAQLLSPGGQTYRSQTSS